MSKVQDRDLFKTEDIVAVLDEGDQDFLFSIYRLTEPVKKSYTGDKQINAIKYDRDGENQNQYVSSEEESLIEVSTILRKVLRIIEGVVDDDGVERPMIVLANKFTNSLIQLAKHALESGSEDQTGEEEHTIGKRSPKKPKKQPKEDKPEGKGPARAESEGEEESREAPESQEDMQEEPSSASKRVKAPKAPKTPKQAEGVKKEKAYKEPKKPREPKVKKVAEYKRGKFNIRIQELPEDHAHDSTSTAFSSECCDICSNRECIRAVATKNVELLKSILTNKNRITTILQPWGPEDPVTAFDLALRMNDQAILDVIIEEMKASRSAGTWTAGTLLYKAPERFGIETIDTGFNDKYAYGVATRKVALGRGNREGVNAMSSDSYGDSIADYLDQLRDGSNQELWKEIMKHATVETFKKFISVLNIEYNRWFAFAVRSANLELASFIAEYQLKNDGYGLNQLHVKALTSKTPEELGVVRSASVKKKSMGEFLILPIYCAAINPNVEVFKKMYELLEDKFMRDELSSGVIFYAAANSNHEILEFLLERGTEFREANKKKITALMVAAELGRHKNVELLLKRGDVHKKKSRDGYAAIHYAAMNNHIQTIEVLLANGADINLAGKDRMTALAIASARGHYDTVKYLLSKGAKTIKKDKFKRTALILALKNCHGRIATLLITQGCPVDEPDSSDNFPIHYACAYGCYGALESLVKAGADPNVYSSWKLTPIAAAMLKNHYAIINKLLEYPNIDVNCKDDKGRTLLSNSIRNLSDKSVKFAELVVTKHKADIKIPDLEGKTALYHLYEINSVGFFPISNVNITLLRDADTIRREVNTKAGWFLKLSQLLSASSLELFNFTSAKDANTPIGIFSDNFAQLLSFDLISFVASQSSYNQYNYNRNQQAGLAKDISNFLEGNIAYKQSIYQFIIDVLQSVSQIYTKELQASKSIVVNEFEKEKTSCDTFSEKNEKILPNFLKTFLTQHFMIPKLRTAVLLSKNENTNQTKAELDSHRRIIKLERTAFDRILLILINELKLSVQGKFYPISAKSIVLDYLASRWDVLFVVPEEKNSKLSKIANTTPAVPQQTSNFGRGLGGFGGGGMFGQNLFGGFGANQIGGFGANQFGGFGTNYGQQNIQAQEKEEDIRKSKGVNEEIYEELKEVRYSEIKNREDLIVFLLEQVAATHHSTIGESWKEQYRFCISILEKIPSIFFMSSVNKLGLSTFEDAQFVLKNCKKMIESNVLLAKRLFQLAQLGVAEFKAESIGSERSLLFYLVDILPKLWMNTSAYIDLKEKKVGTEIYQLELNTRLSFIRWMLEQFIVQDHEKKEILKAIEADYLKPERVETYKEKLELQLERRAYQRSLPEAFDKMTSVGFYQFACGFGRISKFPDAAMTDEERLFFQKTATEISIIVTEKMVSKISINHLVYCKHALLASYCNMNRGVFNNLYAVESEVAKEQDVNKRKAARTSIFKHTVQLTEVMEKFRITVLTLVCDAFKQTHGQEVKDSEETHGDFVKSDRMNTMSQEQTSLNRFLTSVVCECMIGNVSDVFALFTLDTTDKTLAADAAASISKLQKTELQMCVNIFSNIVQHEVFADHKLNKHAMVNVIRSIGSVLKNIFTISNKPQVKHVLQDVQVSKLKIAQLLLQLLEQLQTKAYDDTKQLPQEVLSRLEKYYEDKAKGTSIKMSIEYETYLIEADQHPVFMTTSYIGDAACNNIFDFILCKSDQQQVAISDVEVMRKQVYEKLLQVSKSMFKMKEKNKELNHDDLFKWSDELEGMICSGQESSIREEEVKTYMQQLEEVNTIRRSVVEDVARIYCTCYDLKKCSSSDGRYVIEDIFKTYRTYGWNTSAHDTMMNVFKIFFMHHGTLALDIATIRNPLFTLAQHADFVTPPFLHFMRIDFSFFHFVLQHVEHPNLVYTTVEHNVPVHLHLYSHAFKYRNVNFLRAMLQHQAFDTTILFSDAHKNDIHQLHHFVKCADDLLFIRSFIQFVKIDELILDRRCDGFTPLLRYVFEKTSNPASFIYFKEHPQVFVDLLKCLVAGGCTVSDRFDNKEAMEKERVEGVPFANKYLQGRNVLHMCISSEVDHLLLKYLLEELNVDPNVQDIDGNTPLHMLTLKNQKDVQAMELVLKNKGSGNVLNKKEETCIFEVVRSENLRLLEVLHKHGARFDFVNKDEMSPLVMCIERKNVVAIEWLIQRHADVNFKDRFNRNSLHWALNFADHTANSSFEIEDILIKAGVEINMKDLLGRTALHYPFVKINDYTITFNIDPIESVNSLLTKKSLKIDEKDVFGNTPLLYAAQRGSLVSGLYLLDRHADLKTENVEGNTAFAVAMIAKHEHMAITLLNKGAEWNRKVRVYSKAKREKIYKHVLERVRKGADAAEVSKTIRDELERYDEEEEAKMKGFNDVVELHTFRWAIRNNWQGLAYMILTQGYDIGEAVYATILEGKFNYTFTLLTKREDNDPYLLVDEHGANLAHLISLYASDVNKDLLEKIFRVLVRKGVHLHTRNKKGHTCLHNAAIGGCSEMVHFLLQSHVDADAHDNDGRSSMMLAAQHLKINSLTPLFHATSNKNEHDVHKRNVLHYLCMMLLDDADLLAHLKVFAPLVDVNHRDAAGKLPIHYLLRNQLMEKSVVYLLSLTSNINAADNSGQTILMFALKHAASYDVVLEILKRNPQVNGHDDHYRTCLSNLLVYSKYSESKLNGILNILITSHKLNVNQPASFKVGVDEKSKKNVYKRMTTIDFLFRQIVDNTSTILVLLSGGALLDQPNEENKKSLQLIIEHKTLINPLLEAVLNHKSNTQLIATDFPVKLYTAGPYNSKSISGICYLIFINAPESIVSKLVFRGTNINTPDAHGISPFAFAISEERFKYVEPMMTSQVEAGRTANLDIKVPIKGLLFAPNAKLTTPLCSAIKHQQNNLVQFFLFSGASETFEAVAGRCPAYYLLKYNLKSALFANFFRGFKDAKDYKTWCAGDAKMPNLRWNFTIAMQRKIGEDKQEEYRIDPLYYAVYHKMPISNLELMLNYYPALNYVDPYTSNSAFSLALLQDRSAAEAILRTAEYNTEYFKLRGDKIAGEDRRTAEEKKIALNTMLTKTVVFNNEQRIERYYPLNFMYNNNYSKDLILMSIMHGADFNLQDGEKQQNLIMLLVFENDFELLESICKLADARRCCRFDGSKVDIHGRTPIHMVVNSHKNGSFENVPMLQLLAKHYDINQQDNNRFPPVYYASLQDSGVMQKALLDLGATPFRVPFGVRRAPTSLISFSAFPTIVPNFEEDADVFMKQQEDDAKKVLAQKKQLIPIDDSVPSNIKNTSQVLMDEQHNAYDVYMTKVDIKKGLYGGMVFYRMQLLHETNRDMFIVFTRYGRIGDTGQHQLTSFSKKEEALAEFKNIFKSKSGNEWENVSTFHRQKKKYKLVKFMHTSEKECIKDFYADHHEQDLPATSLSESIKDVFKEVVNTKVLFSRMNEMRIDISKLPLSKLNKPEIMQALNLLFEIKKTAKELREERQVDVMHSDAEKIFELLDELAEMTSEFFELIPSTNYRTYAPPPMEDENTINHNITTVRQLLDVEVAVKILLGARLNIKQQHPIEYCYNSLNIKMVELDNLSVEKTAILDYMGVTYNYGTSDTVKVFALERKGEVERFLPYAHTKNRKLLWHGSRTMNFLGVLNKGLLIAPPEAPSTGHMFGKGIYFSDSFNKSYGYCGGGNIKMILLCEVALGKPLQLYTATNVTTDMLAADGCDSVAALGKSTPNPRKDVVIANGMILPAGEMLERRSDAEQQRIVSLNFNEYVVYNEAQVKIRYLCCLK